jgi:hypothetical protein
VSLVLHTCLRLETRLIPETARSKRTPGSCVLSDLLRRPNLNTGESNRYRTTSPESQQQHAGAQAKKDGHCRQQSRR